MRFGANFIEFPLYDRLTPFFVKENFGYCDNMGSALDRPRLVADTIKFAHPESLQSGARIWEISPNCIGSEVTKRENGLYRKRTWRPPKSRIGYYLSRM